MPSLEGRCGTGNSALLAIHSSTLAWKIPWTEEPGRICPWGREESDATERLHFTRRAQFSNLEGVVPARLCEGRFTIGAERGGGAREREAGPRGTDLRLGLEALSYGWGRGRREGRGHRGGGAEGAGLWSGLRKDCRTEESRAAAGHGVAG